MKTRILLSLLFLSVSLSNAQNPKGTKERVKLYSKAIEGNLIGDPAERDVTIYLPPSYPEQSDRRYPVLYMLHGYTDDDSKWFGWEEHWINLHEVLDETLAGGQSKEMIVVMPNAYNRFQGSMYSSSVTIGDWETFVSEELVDFVDSNYRTIPQASSRGLAGHSMGGYGSIRLGMKYPEVWSAIYLLSPCCMVSPEGNPPPEFLSSVEAITTPDQIDTAGFMVKATLASAAAWSPNPNKPPLYLNLPFEEGELVPSLAAKFRANQTLNIVDQYIHNLKELTAIGMDVGDKDGGITLATKKLHEVLEDYDLPHYYEMYEGDHLNRIAERIKTKMLPFFSENLVFE